VRTFLIGDVAARTGLAVSALRYYDQLGLLGDIPRQGGVRHFPATVLRRLALIRAAQEAGFPLAEIKLLLDQQPDSNTRQQWETLATRRLPELDAMIERLTRLRNTVADCLACGCLSLASCAMLHNPGAADEQTPLQY
jgi:MerR family transcriptional regulator, redox-sensitive transcriptional activator SoxR